MGPSVYPPVQQNPQPFYRPDYQFGYPQGKDKSFSGDYGEYYNSQWTLPPAWTESGVMLVLPADPGLWSEVISRWESITINRLNNQTWSDNKAKLAFVENFLGENLEIPPENAYIILETDGCMKGWGGIVKWKKSKGGPKSSERIYAYASGKFSTTQSTIDAEINACINTLEKLKIYYLDKHQELVWQSKEINLLILWLMPHLCTFQIRKYNKGGSLEKSFSVVEGKYSLPDMVANCLKSSKNDHRINCLTCDVIFCGSSAIASRAEYASGLRPICNDEQLNDFVQALYENNCHLDMYTEHQGYDILEMINDDKQYEDKSDSDFEDVEKGDNLDDVKDIVDFQTQGGKNVDIPKLSIYNPRLNKLVGKGRFVGEMEDPIPGLKGMKFESLSQLKQYLANYGVTLGYQLIYMQNDAYKLLVKCGRDVSAGKCAGKRGKKRVQIDDSLDELKGKVSEGSFDKDLGKGSAGGSFDKGKRKL
nr:ribosomal protein L7A/L8 [Tanacetum cinerariifolium]